MTTFKIEPFVGPLPLLFGMTATEVEEILGPPSAVRNTHYGTRAETRNNIKLGYDSKTEKLTEAIFTPGAILLFSRGRFVSEF